MEDMSASETEMGLDAWMSPFHLLTSTTSTSDTATIREVKRISRYLGGRGSLATHRDCLQSRRALTMTFSFRAGLSRSNLASSSGDVLLSRHWRSVVVHWVIAMIVGWGPFPGTELAGKGIRREEVDLPVCSLLTPLPSGVSFKQLQGSW